MRLLQEFYACKSYIRSLKSASFSPLKYEESNTKIWLIHVLLLFATKHCQLSVCRSLEALTWSFLASNHRDLFLGLLSGSQRGGPWSPEISALEPGARSFYSLEPWSSFGSGARSPKKFCAELTVRLFAYLKSKILGNRDANIVSTDFGLQAVKMKSYKLCNGKFCRQQHHLRPLEQVLL